MKALDKKKILFILMVQMVANTSNSMRPKRRRMQIKLYNRSDETSKETKSNKDISLKALKEIEENKQQIYYF